MANRTYGSATRTFSTDAAPTDGTTGSFAGFAPKGAQLVDETSGVRYVNTGTQASPVWSRALVAQNVAASNVLGGQPLLFRIDITAGALGNTDVVTTEKIRVIDAFLILRGAGVSTTTLQVKNGTSAITNAMAASGSDTALVRATTLDDAAWEIAAGGTLRVTSATGATQPDATVYVIAHRVD